VTGRGPPPPRPADGRPNRLREWRRIRGLTQDQLAQKVGTTKAVISNLERGDRGLSADWLLKLGPALGVDPGALLPGSEALPAELAAVWAQIPEDRRALALATLKAFAGEPPADR
jgi:transcriptional regulator with XRE-family HTH domain